MDIIRFGIIGYGAQGKNYASILQGLTMPGVGEVSTPQNCVLSAVADVSGKGEEEFKDNKNIIFFRDWKEMIDEKACDAVALTVPHFLHSEIAIYAMEHGIHVLCEKPAAVQASEVEKMIAVSKAKPEIAFGLMLNQRANPLWEKVKTLIDSGELGEIRRSNWIINNWWRPDNYYKSSPWRGTWSGEGGGLLVNQAPHQLDLWAWLCGEPSKVYAICKEGAYRDIDVENDVTILTEYENGATGTFISCTHDPFGTDRLEIDLSKGKIVIENSKKVTIHRFAKDESEWNDTMEFRMFAGNLRRNLDAFIVTEEWEESNSFGEDYVKMFENFAEHIVNKKELIAPGNEGLFAVQIANTAQLSAAYDRTLQYPCSSREYDEYLARRMQEEKKESTPVLCKNIGHTSFNAKNMKEMLIFYCDVLGMKVLFTTTHGELLEKMKRKVGDNTSEEMKKRVEAMEKIKDLPWVSYLKMAERHYLELFYPGPMPKKDFENRQEYYGYMKLNFEVDDIHEIKARLEQYDISIDQDIHPASDGSLELVVHDPDRNEVQFVQYTKDAMEQLGIQALSIRGKEDALARCTTQVAYQVKNITKMRKFYCDQLGFKNVRRVNYGELIKKLEQGELGKSNPAMIAGMKSMSDLAWIDFCEVAPHQYIELFYTYGGNKKEETNLYGYYGYQHLCLEVEDIHKAWEQVIANGITPDTQIEKGVDGAWQFWIVDPDGNRIEMMQYVEGAKQLY